jgi:hypothetical protein
MKVPQYFPTNLKLLISQPNISETLAFLISMKTSL